jgi:CubicO group peptidase (beta-lactamase class C family)
MRLGPRLVVLIAALSVATATAQSQQSLSAVLAQVDAYAGGEYEKDPVGSLTVGVIAGPAVVWTKSYGYADIETRRPASDETVYRVGSITKQFTGLMLLQLAERGKVRLTDPAQKYLPEMSAITNPYAGTPSITLLQLATMTSGLKREPEGSFQEHSVGPVSKWDQVVLTMMPRVGYAHEPGTKYLYSNIGYAMLGLALGRAAGQPYTEWVEQQILKPLGMMKTAFEPDASMRTVMARGYDIEKDKSPDCTAADRERRPRLSRAERRAHHHRARPGEVRGMGTWLRT